jgi:hypothetical protein
MIIYWFGAIESCNDYFNRHWGYPDFFAVPEKDGFCKVILF